MIAIIDYEVGNLGAIANMFQRLGFACVITKDSGLVDRASRIVLPGNGSFDACMRGLHASGLLPTLERRVRVDATPLLGICVGAQILGRSSEEGYQSGLGWLAMDVRRLSSKPGLRIPHMGWNCVARAGPHPLVDRLSDDARFYFSHSFCMHPDNADDVLLRVNYGETFAAAVAHENVTAVQFHPEKSHRYGRQLLASFAEGAECIARE